MRRAVPPEIARNCCPRCAYDLSGMPGVPLDPYEAFEEEVDCPECGLHLSRGSRCLAGASEGLPLSAGKGEYWPLWVGVGSLLLIVAATIGTQVWAPGVTAWQWFYGRGGRSLVFMAPLIGLLVPTFLALRRWRIARELAGGAGGRVGDTRMLVEPGVLSIFRGGPTAEPVRVAAGDVRSVQAFRRDRILSGKEDIDPFILTIDGPLFTVRSPLSVMSVLLPPAPDLAPEEVAAAVLGTLRSSPGQGAVLPPELTKATPGVPPVCPQCRGLLPESPETLGDWVEPLQSAVRCPHCALEVPAGAVVMNGWRSSMEAMPRRGRTMLLAIVAVVAAAVVTDIALRIALPASTSTLPSAVLPVAVIVFISIGLPWFLARVRADRAAPRPRARFQPSSQTWIVEPGQLTILQAPKRRGQQAARTVVPGKGISRIEFVRLEQGQVQTVLTDALRASGTAPQLGFYGWRDMHLQLYAGLDRAELALSLNALLRGLTAPAARN
ncbi:MAG: hypothetical protein U0636_07745 [Phycisphaerales bacterium]